MPRTRAQAPEPEATEETTETAPDLVKEAIELFDEEFKTLNIQQKIARISGMMGGLQKRGYNAFHKYHYVTEADVVDAVRRYLAAAGILIIPNAHTVERTGDLTTLMVEYVVTDGNEAFTFSMPGQGSDKGDKGVYKAMTGSQKYAIMKLFKIETGDDPESDTKTDERAAQPDQKAVTVTGGERGTVRRGGHTTNASAVQVRRINELTKQLNLERFEIANVLSLATNKEFVLPSEETEQGTAILTFVRSLTTEEAGEVITALADRVADVLAESSDTEAGGYG